MNRASGLVLAAQTVHNGHNATTVAPAVLGALQATQPALIVSIRSADAKVSLVDPIICLCLAFQLVHLGGSFARFSAAKPCCC